MILVDRLSPKDTYKSPNNCCSRRAWRWTVDFIAPHWPATRLLDKTRRLRVASSLLGVEDKKNPSIYSCVNSARYTNLKRVAVTAQCTYVLARLVNKSFIDGHRAWKAPSNTKVIPARLPLKFFSTPKPDARGSADTWRFHHQVPTCEPHQPMEVV